MEGINKKTISYIGLFFVVFIWGAAPLLTLQLYKFYSPAARVCFSELVLLITYIIMSKNHLKELNKEYIKIGVSTGIFLSLATITQHIGLPYTTPARFAFLENLSCITVPVLMYILKRKKPTATTVLSCLICLLSAFVLNGASLSGASWGIGEILCAIAGLLYGFNIAGTSAYAKKLYAPLYLAVQATVGFVISLIFTVILNFTTVTTPEGVQMPMEKAVFSFSAEHILLSVLCTLVVSALCWTIRTNTLKHIDASIVAVIMPFSAVITGILSVLSGKDSLNLNLIFGSVLGVLAILLSSFDDIFKRKTDKLDKKAAA